MPEYALRKSTKANKKYDAVLSNGFIVSFGDKNYQHYRDSTPLKLYSYLDHGDKKRRDNFKSRHAKNIKVKHSAAWFGDKYLW